jgi:histidine kinase/DNA gyrase B/HSP90-like ATPase
MLPSRRVQPGGRGTATCSGESPWVTTCERHHAWAAPRHGAAEGVRPDPHPSAALVINSSHHLRSVAWAPGHDGVAKHGAGLGLATVNAFATEAGGALHVESDPGHGTRVEIVLPRAPMHARPLDAADARHAIIDKLRKRIRTPGLVDVSNVCDFDDAEREPRVRIASASDAGLWLFIHRP